MLLLTAGFIAIKRGQKEMHRTCMLTALIVSALFLITYIVHKALRGGVHMTFEGEGFWRLIYYTLLISHIILAMVILPLVIRTFLLAIRGEFERHRSWARWTFPLWYYVSVTGVLVYLFLYVWF